MQARIDELRGLERLTYSSGDTSFSKLLRVPCGKCGEKGDCDSCDFGKILDRLAMYETHVPALLDEVERLQAENTKQYLLLNEVRREETNIQNHLYKSINDNARLQADNDVMREQLAEANMDIGALTEEVDELRKRCEAAEADILLIANDDYGDLTCQACAKDNECNGGCAGAQFTWRGPHGQEGAGE